MNLLVRWILGAIALYVTIHIVPGLEPHGSILWLLLAALVLGFLNALARPVLFLLKALTFPLSCLTLGLWTLVLTFFVNVLLFYFVGKLEWGFQVESFGAAALGALVMSVFNVIINVLSHLFSPKKSS